MIERMNTSVKENVRSKSHQGKNYLEDLGHCEKIKSMNNRNIGGGRNLDERYIKYIEQIQEENFPNLKEMSSQVGTAYRTSMDGTRKKNS